MNKWLHKVLTMFFGVPEEINGDHRCGTYLYRWFLIRTRWFKAYLHHFVGDDWSRDFHDHPKRFISIGLWGWYIEQTPCHFNSYCDCQQKIYLAPWLRSFPASHIHRLRVPSKNCWTIVIVLKTVREWGFWHEGRFIQWHDYVYGYGKEVADKMKACQ